MFELEQVTTALAGLLNKNETPAAPTRATLRGFEQRSLDMARKWVSINHNTKSAEGLLADDLWGKPNIS